MKNLKSIDKIMALLFALLTIALVVLAAVNSAFFKWAFERHQNMISWYLRPLALLPFCYFAYKHSWSGIFGTIFFLMTSMFWFPKPDSVSPQAIQFLAVEQEYLTGVWSISKIMTTLLVPFSLAALAFAFWKRNIWSGLLVVALMAIAKGIWSLAVSGEAGKSTMGPVILGVLICPLIYFGYRKLKK